MRAPAPDPPGYARRRPEETDLYRLVSAWLPTFVERFEGKLPRFVLRALERYLRCGRLSEGFARVYCPSCGDDMLVAWSCQGRAICPSCGGRRMADTAAHLVDRVLPRVPIRQWVVTLPFALRPPLAFAPGQLSAVRRCFVRTVARFYVSEARAAAFDGGRTGAVSVIQRFGSAANLNPHLHVLFLDGTYRRPSPDGPLVFRPIRRLSDEDVAAVLASFEQQVVNLVARQQETADDATEEDESSSRLAQLVLGSTRVSGERQRDGPAPRQGRRHAPRVQPLCVAADGFTLHARTHVRRHRRGDLEVLCRYVLRPAVTIDRVRWREDGQVDWTLPRPWSDGTTRLSFHPLAFLSRLAALVPPPRAHQIVYHGVLAPAADWRQEVVAGAPSAGGVRHPGAETEPIADNAEPNAIRPRRLGWAALLRRTLGIDVTCPRCGSKRRVLALVQDPTAIRQILEHLDLADPPIIRPPRGPPQLDMDL